LEQLERRLLLSLAADGGEFRVNTVTGDAQTRPAVAIDADGHALAVWDSVGADGSADGVLAQRYGPDGVAAGEPLLVNSYTGANQWAPAVAADADGDFIVVYASGQDGSSWGVFGQRISATGARVGIEFQVNTFTTGTQAAAAVAANATGEFVVAWESFGQDGSDEGIYARRFDAAGVPLADEFRVNSHTTGSQAAPAVAIDASGDFVVAWSGVGGGDIDGVFARRFSSAGVAQGGQFRVNTYTTSFQAAPAVAMDAGGDFVIAYNSMGQDGSAYGVYARRYAASGAAQGGAFRVNTFTTGTQSAPSASMDADGDFLIAWQSFAQDGSNQGVFAQHYSAAGAPQGAEFRINTYTTGNQDDPTVAMNADGDATIAWTSFGQDGSSFGIYAQRYVESNPDAAPPLIAAVFPDAAQVLPYTAQHAPLGRIIVSFSEAMDAGTVTDPGNWLLSQDGSDITANVSAINYGFDSGTQRYRAALELSSPIDRGNLLVLARPGVQDAAGNGLDGDFSGAAGGSFALPFSLPAIEPLSDEFIVNTFTTGVQGGASVAVAPHGDFVVSWASREQFGGSYTINAQRYDASGVPQGGEMFVNSLGTAFEGFPNTGVAINAARDFIVAWAFHGQFIAVQRYDAGGNQQGNNIVIFPTVQRNFEPRVAMHDDGSFVVVWTTGDVDEEDVVAQRFNAAGVAQGGIFTVNTYTTDFQRRPEIAMDADGDFVITWSGSGATTAAGDNDVFAQRYNAAGVPQGGNFLVNIPSNTFQAFPDIAIRPQGDFIIAWHHNTGSMSGQTDFDIHARRFNALGVPQGIEFRANEQTTGDQMWPKIAADDAGNFALTWSSGTLGGPNLFPRVMARSFSATGVSQGPELQVNAVTTLTQQSPRIAMDADGSFVVAWHGVDEPMTYGVLARRFEQHLTPTVAALAAAPDPVLQGQSFTLTASGASDDGAIARVSFYRESNGVAGLQVGFQGDTLIGSDTTPTAGQWSATIATAGVTPGSHTYWAQATDSDGMIGRPASTTHRLLAPGTRPVRPGEDVVARSSPLPHQQQLDEDDEDDDEDALLA
jgi:hypothetical protein